MLLQRLVHLGLLVSTSAIPLTAQDSIQETRNTLKEWVQTRQIISEEQNDWKTEESILKDTKALLSNCLLYTSDAADD